MPAEYKMQHNPLARKKDEKEVLYPRLVSKGTVGTDEICRYAQDNTSISSADMKGALEIVGHYVVQQLKEGYTVYIEGIGYLMPTLKSRPVTEANELRSESIHFKNIAFRCDTKLKKKLKSMVAYKASVPKQEKLDIEERRSRLFGYLDRHDYITSTYYRALNDCSKYSAQNDLKQFVADGILTRSGFRSSTIYRRKDSSTPVDTEKKETDG